MGPQLALAVFGSIFYNWNKKRGVVNSPIDDSNEIFGLGGLSLQASSFNEITCKWVSKKTCELSHFLVNKHLAIRHLQSLHKTTLINEIIGFSSSLGKAFSEETRPFHDFDEENYLKFGYSQVGDKKDAISVCCEEIAKICSFFESSDATYFLKSKGFSGDIGMNKKIAIHRSIRDLVTFANYLSITIIVFTRSPTIPFVPFFPKLSNPATYNVYIILASQNDGTFSALEPITKPTPKKVKTSVCSCGRSGKIENRSACTDGFNYKSRCPCLKEKRKCNDECSCNGCENPFGRKEKANGQDLQRKRQKSKITSSRKSGKHFLAEKGEGTSNGHWSDMETILLYSIRDDDVDESGPDRLSELYNENCQLLNTDQMLVRKKSRIEIQAKLESASSAMLWFKNSLLKM